MKYLTIGFILLSFAIFLGCLHFTSDFIVSLVLPLVIVGLLIYATYKYLDKHERKADHNRFESVYIVGMHPTQHIPPVLPRFADQCIFVEHRNVNKEAEKYRKRFKEVQNPHDPTVYEFSWMEAVDELAVNETWSAEESENNFPARIVRTIMDDRAKVHVRQYKAGPKEYRKVVMGQTIEF